MTTDLPESPLYLAIDAGGTKADYLLADGQHELARARSATIKRMRVDAPTAAANLKDGLEQLSQMSGRSLRDVRRTCVGTAGNTVPLVVDWLREALPKAVGGELLILGDVEIALDAAFHGGPGVLVLAGTGSNVAGRRADGALLGAGGYGPALADQGSGARIGLSALRAAFLAKDERRESILMESAIRYWELTTEDDLVAFANLVPPPDFSKLSRLVYRCALQGDRVAQEVLEKEGRDLGYLARLVMRQIMEAYPADAPERPLPGIAFAGSIMEHVPEVRTALLQDVHSEFAGAPALPGVVDPVMGALWRARAEG